MEKEFRKMIFFFPRGASASEFGHNLTEYLEQYPNLKVAHIAPEVMKGSTTGYWVVFEREEINYSVPGEIP